MIETTKQTLLRELYELRSEMKTALGAIDKLKKEASASVARPPREKNWTKTDAEIAWSMFCEGQSYEDIAVVLRRSVRSVEIKIKNMKARSRRKY